MDWGVVLNIALVVLVIFGIAILAQLFRMLGSLNNLVKSINKEVSPLLTKLQTTIDDVNSELERVDEIVASVAEVSEKVQVTTRIAQEVISSPLIKLASFSAGTKKALASLIGRKRGS